VIGVKFTLVPIIAALLFAGMFAIAADNERSTDPSARAGKSDSAERRSTPLIPADSKFLASLRFWEKDKSQPQPQQQPQPPAAVAPRTSSTSATPVVTRNVPAGPPPAAQPVSPAPPYSAPIYSAAPGSAPEPPSIHPPYIEQHRSVGSVGNAPLPEWSTDVVQNANERGSLVTPDMKANMKSHVSYSFDSRDWIESFPFQEESPRSPVTTIQTTSFRASALQENTDTNESDWDGQATNLTAIASIRDEMNKLQAVQHDQTARTHVPAVPAPAMSAPAASVPAASVPAASAPPQNPPVAVRPKMDLSPSYQRRLRYVQTCGVVVVQANFPLTEIAAILDEINMLQYDLTRYIGVPAAKEKIELCLFRDEGSYIEFLKEHFPRAPRNRRALYVKLDDRPGTLMVQKSKDFEVDLRHEMTHAIIHASIPRVPIWLDEGLAKYFEVPPQDRAKNHPYMAQVRRNARLGAVPFLDRLTKLETIDDMGVKEYRDSWAWTHFLIHRSPETHRLLAAYLQMLADFYAMEMEGDYVSTGSNYSLSSGRGQETPESIPSLKLYLDDMMSNQREAFREHFSGTEK